ncbi:MAG: mandelate racemase/muconate lactonizing enzyme family protein [Anaerolineae bacterium]
MPTALIEQISVCQCHLTLDFTYSPKEFGGHLTDCHPLLFRVQAGGQVGLGECFSDGGEWELALESAQRLLGADPMRLEGLLESLSCARLRERRVREGLSIALYDLVGRLAGVPTYVLLGGCQRRVVPGMPVVHVAPPEVMARRAAKWVDEGYRYVKLKLYGEAAPDLAAVERVRRQVGPDVELQADANRGYADIGQAQEQMRRLAGLGVAVVEDLLDGGPEAYCELPRDLGPKIMVDNEAWWPNVQRVVALGAADVINHHPNNQGGLGTALRVDAVATAAGLITAIGSSGLLGIQDAAFQTLSAVVGLQRPCEDIGLLPYCEGPTAGEYHWQGYPSAVAEPYPIVSGQVRIPARPGLGVEVDEARLASLREREAVVRT